MLFRVLALTIFPAGKHGFEMGADCVPGRNQVHVSDKEGEHHEGAYRMDQGDGRQIKVLPQRYQFVVIQVEQAGYPQDGIDQQFDRQIGLRLHGIVLAGAGDDEGMFFTLENTPGVVANDLVHTLHGWNVLTPFARDEMPENGKYPENDQCPSGKRVHLVRLGKTKQVVGAVYFEAGNHHADDKQRLCPVPEALEAGKDVNAFQVRFP